MKAKFLKNLICYDCKSDFQVKIMKSEGDEIIDGVLICNKCDRKHQICNYIPRFVKAINYAEGFGFQWNKFFQLQIDKYNGTNLSENRFYRQSKWSKLELKGKLVLEAGCGAGRFTQICLDTGARIISFDYSNSVEACFKNNYQHDNLLIFQGDIYRIPLREHSLDYIFCYGVLQHTPSPKKAFLQLTKYLRPGGKISIDIYRHGIWDYILPKHFVRLFTSRMPYDLIYKYCEYFVPKLLPLSDLLGKIPKLGIYIRRMVPIANIRGIAQLNEEDILNWSLLDTFDMYAAKYDKPATINEVRKWFTEAKLSNIEVVGRKGLVIGSGMKDI